MSHKKASLSSHRDKGAKAKAASYMSAEMKDSAFSKKGSKSGADAKLPSVNKAPYSSKDGKNKGRCVTRNEHLCLYDLHNTVDAMRDESLDDIEFFYKVMCSAKRHMPLKRLESFRNFEGDSLVISTHKFIRMYEQRYKRPPPRSRMTNDIRMAYANSICNYHLTKNGVVIPGAYYNPETDPPISSPIKSVPPAAMQVKSALNGAQGSVTGTDDVEDVSHTSISDFSNCLHPWCAGHIRIRNRRYVYCFNVSTLDSRVFVRHWRHCNVGVIPLDVLHSDNTDDCMCFACAITLLHNLHVALSAVNGNNGSYTNTDDHDTGVLCTSTACRLGVHYHRAGKKKPTSGAAQRIAEKTAQKDTPKPVGELTKCVDPMGVPIPCLSCEKLGEKFHLPRTCGVKKSSLVGDAIVNDAEKEQGLLDAEHDLASEEYDFADSGAAGGGPEHPVLCKIIEPAVKSKTVKAFVVSQPPTTINTESSTGPFKGTPVMEAEGSSIPKLTFLSDADATVERSNAPELLPTKAEASDETVDIASHLADDMNWSLSGSPRSVGSTPDLDPVEISSFADKTRLHTIMVNTEIPLSHGFSRLIKVYLAQLVAVIDRSPKTDVRYVDRRARMTTSMTATVDNSWLRLVLPSSWTWEEEVYENYDLMTTVFYNATIERNIFSELYNIGLSHFAAIPIGQYDPSKPVYSYFLARLVTGMQDVLGPDRVKEYYTPHRIQTTMNTYMALSNALVLYHYQLVKTTGGA